ncbi:MAG: hypothetical protein IKM33_02720, partial [Clostridia bacterium]|nr:hypothetical protein [Clostridia bacterium]
GFVGLRPKCKTQNAKCKIGERGRGSTQNAKSKYPSWLKEFLGCKLPQVTIRLAFAEQKASFILHFAFCISQLPDKPKFK